MTTKSPAYHVGRAIGKLEILIKQAEAIDPSADNVVLTELKALAGIHDDIYNSLENHRALCEPGVNIAGQFYRFVADGGTDCPPNCATKNLCDAHHGAPCLLFGKGHFEK